ncbi:MAG: enoyl-CoA hydratase/isomerase family protein, partial [Phycisphaerae bacterium]|nr:enoyl-CoA hydratase/isomerase family protein [Phycisphaerae bacterium]
MPDAQPPITTAHDGPVAVVSLNRPDRRNAQTPDMLADLVAAAGALPDSCRAVVLAGRGAVFCAGFDMRLVHDDPEALPRLLRGLSAAVRTLRRLPLPVVVAAHGAAVAGGCALLAGADVVLTNREARLGYPVVRLGISPAINAAALRRTLTDGAARERTLDPDLISGSEAARIGLAHHCLDRPEDV